MFYTKHEIDNIESDAERVGFSKGLEKGYDQFDRDNIQALRGIAEAIASKPAAEDELVSRAAERARQMLKQEITNLDNKVARLQEKMPDPDWLRLFEIRVKNVEGANLRQAGQITRQDEYIKSLETKLTEFGLTVGDILTNFTTEAGKPGEKVMVDDPEQAISFIEKAKAEGRQIKGALELEPVAPTMTVRLPAIPSNGHAKSAKKAF